MPDVPARAPRHVRIFLASPGDVLDERKALRDMLLRLEREPLIRRDFTLDVVSWDDPDAPAPMLATLTPQQAILRSLPRPSECDITIVVLWGRMGTPLEERKPDGTPYLSGTEWEFEDARRAGAPILLYRKTAPLPGVAGDTEEARQRQAVERFFEQFSGPGGSLRGSFATYATTEELVARVRTDVQSLLPTLDRGAPEEPPAAGWLGGLQARIAGWHAGRLLLVLAPGLATTIVAWAAFAAFADALQSHDAPLLAHVLRYALAVIGIAVPLALFAVIWAWLGGPRRDARGET